MGQNPDAKSVCGPVFFSSVVVWRGLTTSNPLKHTINWLFLVWGDFPAGRAPILESVIVWGSPPRGPDTEDPLLLGDMC